MVSGGLSGSKSAAAGAGTSKITASYKHRFAVYVVGDVTKPLFMPCRSSAFWFESSMFHPYKRQQEHVFLRVWTAVCFVITQYGEFNWAAATVSWRHLYFYSTVLCGWLFQCICTCMLARFLALENQYGSARFHDIATEHANIKKQCSAQLSKNFQRWHSARVRHIRRHRSR